MSSRGGKSSWGIKSRKACFFYKWTDILSTYRWLLCRHWHIKNLKACHVYRIPLVYIQLRLTSQNILKTDYLGGYRGWYKLFGPNIRPWFVLFTCLGSSAHYSCVCITVRTVRSEVKENKLKVNTRTKSPITYSTVLYCNNTESSWSHGALQYCL